MPSNMGSMKSISKMGSLKSKAAKSDMESAGYKIGAKIVDDEAYTFYAGSKGSDKLVVKQIDLGRVTPRYKANLVKYSLKIERYMGGADDGKPKASGFIRVYDIFKVSCCCG